MKTIYAFIAALAISITVHSNTALANHDDFSNVIQVSNTRLISSLNYTQEHVNGSRTLASAQILNQHSIIEEETASFTDEDVIAAAFELVAAYESNFGALFTTGTTTENGISPRTQSGFELEKLIMLVMQNILDYSYTEANLLAYPVLFENVKFETSSFFPGAVSAPANGNVSYTVSVNAKHIKNSGAPANYETEDARRPTGCYLAPGSVAKITVPSSLIGIGASVLVGAHTWDHSSKPNIKRMDRVTKKYEINSATVTVANPLGGGIYINVPFETNLGTINVALQNVVRSPYYANTIANTTSVSDWQNIQRNYDAPWTDFESDKVMMQVPTSWIYNVSDPSTMMNDWDLAMDGISEMLGRPLVRSKTVVYSQVDVQIRGSANFPGYPQANVSYDPNRDYGGNHSHYLVQGPRNDRTNALTVFFHELGHAEKIYKFSGEIEAFVNFLWVPVYNKKFGVDLETAFNESSTTSINHTIDEAAISWMITENFREGNPMSSTTGQFRQEFSYQPRGYAKYADVVKLFGWEALEGFYTQLNEDYDSGTYESSNLNVNNVPTDPRVLRMSIAAGYDLRPLMHFWGKHPVSFSGLANSIAESGVQESPEIYDLLNYYKSIIPANNAAFRAFGLKDFSESSINGASTANNSNISQSYINSFFRKFWSSYDEDEAEATINEIDNIIDLYFPNGRPSNTSDNFVPDPNLTYYIDNPSHNLRLAATGESEDAYTTSTNTTGSDVQWKFVAKGNGSWHVERAAGGTKPRLRTDNTENTDMQETTSNGSYTYYDMEATGSGDTYFFTLPDGPTNYKRLQIDNSGNVKMVSTASSGSWVSFTITPVSSTSTVVHITKRNATGFAIDGKRGGGDEQNIYLWEENNININQQWIEIDRGEGYYSYQKQGTDYCIDGDNGGGNNQNVYLYTCKPTNYNQQWQKVDAGGGAFKLIKRNASGYALNGGNGGTNEQNVNLYDSSVNSQNLHWFITPIGASSKAIELIDIEEVLVYPNPVANTVTIQGAKDSIIHIYNMNGVNVITEIISNESEKVDLSILKTGLYYAEVITSNKKTILKLIKN